MGLFAAGCAPTASADPYGMRRAAYGMLQVGAMAKVGESDILDGRQAMFNGIKWAILDCGGISRSITAELGGSREMQHEERQVGRLRVPG